MPYFTYTAREKNGALKTGAIQAADRSAAMQELRTKNMVVVSLVDGQKKSSRSIFEIVTPKTLVVLAGGVLLALSAALVIQWAVSKHPKQTYTRKAVQSGSLKTAHAAPPQQTVTNRPTAENGSSVPVTSEQPTETVVTPPVEPQVPLKPTKRAAVAIINADGKTNAPPSGYSSGLERILNMIVNTKKGMPPPPLIKMTPGTDIQKVLNTDIGVFNEDSELTIEQKTNVMMAKQLLKQYLDQGGTADDFLQYYHNELKKAAAERTQAQQEMSKMVAAGDLAGAQRYMEEKNKELGNKGIVLLKAHPAMLGK